MTQEWHYLRPFSNLAAALTRACWCAGHYAGQAVKTLPGVHETSERREWAAAQAMMSYAAEAEKADELLSTLQK